MNDASSHHPISKKLEKYLKDGWKRVHPRVQTLFSILFAVFLLLGLVLFIINQTPLAINKTPVSSKPEKSEDQEKDKSDNGTSTQRLGAHACHTRDWKSIQPKDWSGFTWFTISNGVWTIGSPDTERDVAIYYNTSCVGGTLVEYEVVPRLLDYLNINVYQRGQLRWEIGGGDRRSIELWKNVEGCSTGEIKDSRKPISKKWFLPDHDEILINHPLIIHSALFYLPNGEIRSEVWLTYSSENKNGEVVTTPRQAYFFDFKAGSTCDLFHFPDISQEPYQTGIGLQRKMVTDEDQSLNPPLPKTSFDKFRILPFSYSD